MKFLSHKIHHQLNSLTVLKQNFYLTKKNPNIIFVQSKKCAATLFSYMLFQSSVSIFCKNFSKLSLSSLFVLKTTYTTTKKARISACLCLLLHFVCFLSSWVLYNVSKRLKVCKATQRKYQITSQPTACTRQFFVTTAMRSHNSCPARTACAAWLLVMFSQFFSAINARVSLRTMAVNAFCCCQLRFVVHFCIASTFFPYILHFLPLSFVLSPS